MPQISILDTWKIILLLFNLHTSETGDTYVYTLSDSKINCFWVGTSFTEGPTANVNFHNWPEPYLWEIWGDKSRDVIQGHFIYLYHRKALHFCSSFLKAVPLHPHTSPGSMSQRWSNWENSLCEGVYTSFKKRYICMKKYIAEHCSVKGSKCIQVGFYYENRNRKTMGKFNHNMLSMN